MTETDPTRVALLHLLRAPYRQGGTPYAITNACVLLGHPDKYAPDERPKFTSPGCICGHRKTWLEESA